MTNDSFTFGNVDMYAEYGIRVLHYDTLLPPLRPRKVIIPKRSGAHDYGAKYYDERTIRVECDTRSGLTKDEVRELAYTLSKKNRIRFFNEPDRFYIGRIYDPSELNYIGSIGHEFTLTFVCEPFAYSEPVGYAMTGGVSMRPEYLGTAPTPTRITIVNNGDGDVVGVQIRIRERSDTY